MLGFLLLFRLGVCSNTSYEKFSSEDSLKIIDLTKYILCICMVGMFGLFYLISERLTTSAFLEQILMSSICFFGAFTFKFFWYRDQKIEHKDAIVDDNDTGNAMTRVVILLPLVIIAYAFASLYFFPERVNKITWVLAVLSFNLGTNLYDLVRYRKQ